MNYAGILAGGQGARFGATERPKQFLRLGSASKLVIIHTVEAFLASKVNLMHDKSGALVMCEYDTIIRATPHDVHVAGKILDMKG